MNSLEFVEICGKVCRQWEGKGVVEGEVLDWNPQGARSRGNQEQLKRKL
jgi:hypothetical protein